MKLSRLMSWAGSCALAVVVAVLGGEIVARRVDPEGAFISEAEWDRVCGRRLKSGEDLRGKTFRWIGQAGKRREFRQDVYINTFGFHDREHAVAKGPRTRRVLVVGDSFVEAYQVAMDDAFPRLLEKQLRRDPRDVEVIAVGRSGWGSVQIRAAIEEWAPRMDVDLVVWCFYPGNDIRDASVSATRLAREQESGPLGALWRHQEARDLPGIVFPWSGLNRLLARAWRAGELRREARRHETSYKVPIDFYVYADETCYFVEEGWRRTEEDIRDVREFLSRRGARLVVASLTDALRMAVSDEAVSRALEGSYPDARRVRWRFDLPETRLQAILASEGVAYLNLQAAFRGRFCRDRLPYHFLSDGHWNERGHAIAAELLAPFVRRELSP